MKYLYTIVMAMLVLASCSENERCVYGHAWHLFPGLCSGGR